MSHGRHDHCLMRQHVRRHAPIRYTHFDGDITAEHIDINLYDGHVNR